MKTTTPSPYCRADFPESPVKIPPNMYSPWDKPPQFPGQRFWGSFRTELGGRSSSATGL